MTLLKSKPKFEVHLLVTPNELRTLADKIEKEMPEASIGQKVPGLTVEVSDIILNIVADQSKYNSNNTWKDSKSLTLKN